MVIGVTHDHTNLLVERLRLATSLVHALPQLGLELGVHNGPHVLVSHHRALNPDVTPCEFRRMVADLADHNPLLVGFGWMREITTVEIGGAGTRSDDGIVVIDRNGDAPKLTAFATDLDPDDVMVSARQVAAELIERDPCAIVALREVQIRVDHDEVLRTSVVMLPWSDHTDDDEAAFITTAIAERCAVDALLRSLASRRV